MKQKTLIISISIIMLLFIGLIFQYGEKVIYENSNKGFSVFSFVSPQFILEKDHDISLSLPIKIQNNENDKKKYSVVYVIDDFEIENLEVDILGGNEEVIDPPQKVFDYLKIRTNGDYLINNLINWDDKQEFLTKRLTIQNG